MISNVCDLTRDVIGTETIILTRNVHPKAQALPTITLLRAPMTTESDHQKENRRANHLNNKMLLHLRTLRTLKPLFLELLLKTLTL